LQADKYLTRRIPGTLGLNPLRNKRTQPVKLPADSRRHAVVQRPNSIYIEVTKRQGVMIRLVPQVPGDALDNDRVATCERRIGHTAFIIDKTMAGRLDANARQ
jgi:hypothetical protein